MLPLAERRAHTFVWRLLIGIVALLLAGLAVSGEGRGPDFPHYLAYVRALAGGQGVFLLDTLEELHQPIIITETGYALELRNVGVALFWLPWYHVGQWLAGLWPQLQASRVSLEIVWLGMADWFYGVAAVGVTWACLRRFGRGRVAAITLLFSLLGLSWGYYLVYFTPNPHVVSSLLAALVLWLWLEQTRLSAPAYWAGMGLLCGLLVLVANYNAAFILFPALDWVAQWRGAHSKARHLANGLLFAAVGVVAAAPQLIAWWLLFGSPLAVPYRYQMSWWMPALGETLFSAYHGLFFTTPLALLSVVGLLEMLRIRPGLAARSLLVFAGVAWMAAANLAWWAGASFGARYFITVSPLLALGLVQWLQGTYPRLRLASALFCALWTVLLFGQGLSGQMSWLAYVPVRELVVGQWQVLQTLAQLPNYWPVPLWGDPAAVPVMVGSALALAALYGVWLGLRRGLNHRMPGLALPAVSIVLMGGMLAALGLWQTSRVALADFQAERFYAESWMVANWDPVDLSESYRERAVYHFRRGAAQQAQQDIEQMVSAWPWNRWSRLDPVYDAEFPNASRLELAPGLQLAGSHVTLPVSRLDRRDTLWVTLYWQVDAPLAARVRPALALVAPSGEVAAAGVYAPAHDVWPVEQWPVGAVVGELYPLQIAYTPQASVHDPAHEDAYTLWVSVLDMQQIDAWPLPGMEWSGDEAGPENRFSVPLATVELQGNHAAVAQWVQFGRDISDRDVSDTGVSDVEVSDTEVSDTGVFSAEIVLTGYDAAAMQVGYGDTLLLALYWQAIGPMAGDYKVFVHLEDAGGRRVAQQDQYPLDRSAALTRWPQDAPLRDVYQLRIREPIAPGWYAARIGWYDAQTGARLVRLDETGAVVDDSITIPIPLNLDAPE